MSPRERLFALEHFGVKLGLDHIRTLVEALGRPDRAYTCVHVAGTNGKGSVAAMVERGLRAAGQRTGRYTSPHLATIEERFAIDGEPIDAAAFDQAAADVLALVDRLRERGALGEPPTFFEVTTAIGFELFRRQGVTAAVVEVGLGGRLDATNIVEPLATAITSIAFDHQQHLGTSLTAIAAEKAGIIKPGVPVVIGPMPAEARAVIVEKAHAAGAPLVECAPAAATPDAAGTATPVALALEGAHQHDNAAVAVGLLKLCGERGLGVRREHIVTALTDVRWPARLEWLRVPDCGDVLLDAAHNVAGAEALAAYVIRTTGPLPLVLGLMKDKDVQAIVRALAPAAARIVTTQADSPRALDAERLAEEVRRLLPALDVESRKTPDEALALACRGASRAIVAGSIFLVGPLRADLIARGAATVRYPSKASPFLLT